MSEAKKGRGRPKKTDAPAPAEKSDEEVSSAGEESANEEPPAKKGRGRPASNKPKVEAAPVDPDAPKRGRGRPKGTTKKAKAAAKPKSASGRGRGRPPKNPAPEEDKEDSSSD